MLRGSSAHSINDRPVVIWCIPKQTTHLVELAELYKSCKIQVRYVGINYGQLLVFMCHLSLLQSLDIEKNVLVFIFPPNAQCIASSELTRALTGISER